MKEGAFLKLEVVGVGVVVTSEGAAAAVVVVGKAAAVRTTMDVGERHGS
jgi:hypothetical protein